MKTRLARFYPTRSPFPSPTDGAWNETGQWTAWWVDCPLAGQPPFVTAYRCRFEFVEPVTLRFHVSADERYLLFLDDERLGRGPERGDPQHWFYESFALEIDTGIHTVWALVWSQGEQAAQAQMSVEPGFLFAAEGEYQSRLSTGPGDWEACGLPGWEFLDPAPAVWRGARFRCSRPFPRVATLDTLDWTPVRRVSRARDRLIDWDIFRKRRLQPATLPPMLAQPQPVGVVRLVSAPPAADRTGMQQTPIRAADGLDAHDWDAFASGGQAITLPPQTTRRVIFDLQTYLTAYPTLTVSGGAGSLLRLTWVEACLATPDPWQSAGKGHRDDIEGKYLVGIADEFLPDGTAHALFAPLWFQAGRYVELLVATGESALTLHRLTLDETRYPLESESVFESTDPKLDTLIPLLMRGLQVNANETFFDSPYYEELQYISDARLESLCFYALTHDDRLPRKAMQLFDSSRLANGFLQSRYPCRMPQVIAPFSLWWIGMLWDYAYWRDDPAFVRELLPGMRATMEGFRRHMQANGLLRAPEGWNFMDWVPAWDAAAGSPPGGINGYSGLLNQQLIYALALAADLETRLGESELAAAYTRWSAELGAATARHFWDQQRGLFADDLAHTSFSEHSQCLAVLGKQVTLEQQSRIAAGLRTDPSLITASYAFSHYLLEACHVLGMDDLLHQRLHDWYSDMMQSGLKTPLERKEPSRSDCHGWSSHPLYHVYASILGIRPGSTGFRSVVIRPQPGSLSAVSGTVIHPGGGTIHVDLRVDQDTLTAKVTLPPNLTGELLWGDSGYPLKPGEWEGVLPAHARHRL